MAENIFALIVVICRPLMKELLARRGRELLGQLRKLEAKHPGKMPAEKLKALQKRTEIASKSKLGDTTGPFDVNGKCFGGKRYRDLMRYIGRQCFGIPNWGPHIARTEHITLVHGDDMPRNVLGRPKCNSFREPVMHGRDTQERFYDNARRKKNPFFEGPHRGILQSIVSINSGNGSFSRAPVYWRR